MPAPSSRMRPRRVSTQAGAAPPGSRTARWAQRPVLRTVAAWYARRPFLTTFGLLAAGMVVMVILFAQDAGLTLRQHVFLVVVTIGLAALCTWIIFLEQPASSGNRT